MEEESCGSWGEYVKGLQRGKVYGVKESKAAGLDDAVEEVEECARPQAELRQRYNSFQNHIDNTNCNRSIYVFNRFSC